MADSFYCLWCGTGCPVACYPRHCDKFTCHNTKCIKHGPVPSNYLKEEMALIPVSQSTHSANQARSLISHNPTNNLHPSSFLNPASNLNLLNTHHNIIATGCGKPPNATGKGITNPGQRATYLFPNHGFCNNISATPAQVWLDAKPTKSAKPAAQKPSISQIEEGLFVGNIACVQDQDFLTQMGITAVITILSRPVSNNPNHPLLQTIPLKDRLFLKAEDVTSQDLIQYFPGACEFIDKRLVRTFRSSLNLFLTGMSKED